MFPFLFLVAVIYLYIIIRSGRLVAVIYLYIIIRSGRLVAVIYLYIIIRSGRLAEIRWSVFMSKSKRNLCLSFSRIGVGLCTYHFFFFVWLNWNFLHNSLWITLHTLSYLTPCKFFTPALAFEWLQVSLGPQDSSKYSSRSQQYCSLDGFDSPGSWKPFREASDVWC